MMLSKNLFHSQVNINRFSAMANICMPKFSNMNLCCVFYCLIIHYHDRPDNVICRDLTNGPMCTGMVDMDISQHVPQQANMNFYVE